MAGFFKREVHHLKCGLDELARQKIQDRGFNIELGKLGIKKPGLTLDEENQQVLVTSPKPCWDDELVARLQLQQITNSGVLKAPYLRGELYHVISSYTKLHQQPCLVTSSSIC